MLQLHREYREHLKERWANGAYDKEQAAEIQLMVEGLASFIDLDYEGLEAMKEKMKNDY